MTEKRRSWDFLVICATVIIKKIPKTISQHNSAIDQLNRQKYYW